MRETIIRYWRGLTLSFIFLLTLFFSLWSPHESFIATPKYWWDEAFTVETARTFSETGRLDFTVAPNTPSDKAIALNANGFPMSIPLAGVFSVFGVGVTQARIYMIVWIFLVVSLTYLFLKRFFDTPTALLGTLLVATFSSFYANGRTATGDIPAFFFMLLALWATFGKKHYFLGGILFALAAVTKTSVFHMALPAIGFTLIILERKNSIIPVLKTIAGSLIVILVWFALLLPQPYSFSDLKPAIEFYKNPANKESVLARMPESIPEILFSSTVLYFGLIMFILALAYKQGAFSEPAQKKILIYVLVYALLQSMVFLRSPGWIRYLIGIELFLLMFIFPALRQIAEKFKHTPAISLRIAASLVILLALVQSAQYLFFSNIFSKPNPEREARVIRKILADNPGSTIGFYEAPEIASLIPGNQKYQTVRIGGEVWAGENPLTFPEEKLPTYHWNEFDPAHKSILETHYEKVTVDGVTIWKKH